MSSKKVLEDMMYYHMEQSDLNNIFNKRKPSGLPDHLMQSLPGNLKNWIRDVYSPAFTSLTISESFSTNGWETKFSDEEKIKIMYFWQGDVTAPSSVVIKCAC